MFSDRAASLRVVFGAVLLLKVTYDVSCSNVHQQGVNIGDNTTLPCKLTTAGRKFWVFKNENINTSRHRMNEDGNLYLAYVNVNDSGIYSCRAEDNEEGDEILEERINLTIRVRPPPLVNVSVHLTTIVGLIYWKVKGDGNSPIVNFTAEYRDASPSENQTELEPWRPISPNAISPNARQIDVYHLVPNTSYWFRVWATNGVGRSDPVEVFGHTKYSDTAKELARVFLADIKNFDTRVWVAAVSIVMGTLCVLTVGTCLLLYRECRVPSDSDEEQDVMELVPNIILNPGFVEGSGSGSVGDDQPPPPPVMIRSNGKCYYSQANGSAGEPRKV